MAKVVGLGGFFFKARDPKALAEWYAKQGRHAVYAKNQALPLPDDVPITSVLPESARRLEAAAAERAAGKSPRVRLPLVP